MKHPRIAVAALFAAALVTGCATQPPAQLASQTMGAPSCQRLDAERAAAEHARQAALDEQSNAWKAVVPVAVAAKYAKSHADVLAAEERLSKLAAVECVYR